MKQSQRWAALSPNNGEVKEVERASPSERAGCKNRLQQPVYGGLSGLWCWTVSGVIGHKQYRH